MLASKGRPTLASYLSGTKVCAIFRVDATRFPGLRPIARGIEWRRREGISAFLPWQTICKKYIECMCQLRAAAPRSRDIVMEQISVCGGEQCFS